MQKGSKSKGMNLADVAKLHGMTAQELMPQLRKGIKHEYEHTTSKQVARRTALDHLVEFPDYYDRLDKIEKMHLGGDMSKHLAPNGKPSNLNHEQWHLVRTPEFKAWFGDWENDPQNASKVVDENGEPLVVYHGSIKGINVFKTSIGKNYFSPLKYIAEDFAKYKYGDNSKVYEVFLNVKKPKYFEEIDSELLELEENKSNDGIIAKYVYVDGFNEGKQYITFNSNQIKLADGSNTTFDSENADIRFKRGGRTIAQTPAPISERIYGSKKNVKGSAASKVNRITFTPQLTKSIKNKVDEHNEEYPDNKVTLATAKAVVRRGMGAYSKSHRPTISGGMPNSRQAWGLARLNKFLMKKSGKPVKKAYIQDDDLL